MADNQSPEKIADISPPPLDHRASHESLTEASSTTSEGPTEGATLLAFLKKHIPNLKGVEPREVFPQTAAVPSPTMVQNVEQSAQILESGQIPDDRHSLASDSVKSGLHNHKTQALPAKRGMAVEQSGDGKFLSLDIAHQLKMTERQ